MINFINMNIYHYCTNGCWFCEVKEYARKSHMEFTRWKELRDFLVKLDLADRVTINLVCGEPSLFPDKLRKAKKEIDKIKRVKPVDIVYSTIVCGHNPQNVLDLISDGVLSTEAMMISYDGIDDGRHHYAHHALPILAPIVPCIATVLDSDTVVNIRSILDDMVRYKANSWCYYYLLDDKSYSDEKFIQNFKEIFLPTIYEYKDKLHIYNIENFKYGRRTIRNLVCKYGEEVTVTVKGKVYPCGIMDEICEYSPYVEPTADISDDIDHINRELDRMRKLCVTDTCNYGACECIHCTDCALAAKIRPHTVHQQCALRYLELDAHKSHIY